MNADFVSAAQFLASMKHVMTDTVRAFEFHGVQVDATRQADGYWELVAFVGKARLTGGVTRSLPAPDPKWDWSADDAGGVHGTVSRKPYASMEAAVTGFCRHVAAVMAK